MLGDANKNNFPLKITGQKRKARYRDQNKEDIELNRNSKITMVSEVPFKYHEEKSTIADVFKINDV